MKRIFLAIVMFAFIAVSTAFAQDAAQIPAPKQKTLEELQWQAQAMQNEFLYLQERIKNLQGEYARIQAELKARQAAVKPPEPPKPPEDKKTKK